MILKQQHWLQLQLICCVMERWRPQRSAQVLHPIKCSGVYTDAEGCYTTPSEHADISLKERKDPDFWSGSRLNSAVMYKSTSYHLSTASFGPSGTLRNHPKHHLSCNNQTMPNSVIKRMHFIKPLTGFPTGPIIPTGPTGPEKPWNKHQHMHRDEKMRRDTGIYFISRQRDRRDETHQNTGRPFESRDTGEAQVSVRTLKHKISI